MGAPYTYNLNGLLIGANTLFKVMSIDGLMALPDVVSNDVQLEGADGEAVTARETLAGRTVTLSIALLGGIGEGYTGPDQLYNQLQLATSGITRPFNFGIYRPNMPGRYLKARVRRRSFTMDHDFSWGTPVGAVELKAHDPLIYAEDESKEVLNLNQDFVNTGRQYPRVYPWTYGTQQNNYGAVNLRNDGTYKTPVRFEIPGPISSFSIEHLGQNRVLTYEGDVAQNDTVILNTDNRSVLLNGEASQRTRLTASQWFVLEPGDNYIRYSGVLPEGAPRQTGKAFWRSAWA